MKLSEVAEVIIQPQYGFGSEEHQVPEATIPANSTLFYTVELAELHKVPSCPHASLLFTLHCPRSLKTGMSKGFAVVCKGCEVAVPMIACAIDWLCSLVLSTA